MGNYWLHRISNEWGVAKPLLDKGYLTIGWQYLMSISPTLLIGTARASNH